MSSINETKEVIINIKYNQQEFDCKHTLNYYDDDTLAVGEFDYDTEPYPSYISEEDTDIISDAISEHLTAHCGRGLFSVNDGEEISIEI